MNVIDERKYRNFKLIKDDLERYFQDIQVDCPYGLPQTAVYRQAPCGAVPDPLMEIFLENGYRRNGNYLYTMACPHCHSCISIRVHPQQFLANRNQRRTLARNADITVEIGPIAFSEEKLALCAKFLARRYPGRGNTAIDYYGGFFANNITQSCEFRYYKPDGVLLGVGVVDIGGNWLNAVYYFFDPDEAKRSPGTLNILHLIAFCHRNGIENLFLGYWIKEVRAMNYKTTFQPCHLLINNIWTAGDA